MGIKQLTPTFNNHIRLNKFISNAGVCSRRAADKLIQSGKITVNGQIITSLGYQVPPSAMIKYHNKILKIEKLIYILLNKPPCYITTAQDPAGRKTVLDLISYEHCQARIYPVGRLDYHTTGLLLLTNDGELSKKMAHPANNIKKIYQIVLHKPISRADFENIQTGVILEDGLAQINRLEIVDDDRKCIKMEIHMGKNRIIRRIFEHFNYKIYKLDRIGYANLTKKNLPRGKWHFLSDNAVNYLKYFA